MNSKEYCRTCAHPNMTDKELKHIFSTPDLLAVLRYIKEWNLNIKENDSLPQLICEDCEHSLIRIKEFYQRALKAKEYLELLFARDDECKGSASCASSERIFEMKMSGEGKETDTEAPVFEAIHIDGEGKQLCSDNEFSWDEGMMDIKCVENTEDTKVDYMNASDILSVNERKIKRPKRPFKNRCFNCVYKNIEEEIDFTTTDLLQKHMDAVHDEERPYNCAYCQSRYRTRNGCINHINVVHLGKTMHCTTCQKDINGDASQLRIHIERYHTRGDYECDGCGQKFKNITLYSLNYHKRWHIENKLHKCEDCSKVFLKRAHLSAHLLTHNKLNAFLCTHCGKGTRNKWELRAHLYAKHGIGEAPISCEHCKKTFTQHSHKRLHMDRHHPEKIAEKQIECHLCQKKFENEANLQRHLKFPHKAKDAPQKLNYEVFACPLCPRKFRAEYALTKHAEVHSLEGRPYPCNECDMSFKQPSLLQKHKSQKHSTVRPFPCTHCRKAFSNKSALKEHNKVHEVKDKPFECSICKNKFKFEKSMLRHQLTHAEITLSCKICNKTFVKTEQLNSHINRYHKLDTMEKHVEQADSGVQVKVEKKMIKPENIRQPKKQKLRKGL